MKLLSMQARLSVLDARTEFVECYRCQKIAVMTGSGVCCECSLEAAGQPRRQQHHVHLKKIDPDTVVDIPANLHLRLSTRSDCRYPVLKAPSLDPKVRVAQTITDAAELLEVISSHPPNPDELAAITRLAAVLAKACRKACIDLLKESCG